MNYFDTLLVQQEALMRASFATIRAVMAAALHKHIFKGDSASNGRLEAHAPREADLLRPESPPTCQSCTQQESP